MAVQLLSTMSCCHLSCSNVTAGGQAETEDLRARNAALEERTEEAEGALAAAQAEVEVVTRERQRSVATLTTQSERRHQDSVSRHAQEVQPCRYCQPLASGHFPRQTLRFCLSSLACLDIQRNLIL